MAFVTYENRHNPHVTIHCHDCTQLRKHGGEHTHNQGQYKEHATYTQAATHAAGTDLPLADCLLLFPSCSLIAGIRRASRPLPEVAATDAR